MPLIASADNQWGRYAWPVSGVLTLTLGENLDSVEWKTSLTQADADWDKSDVINSTVAASSVDRLSCTPETGGVEICNLNYGNTGWLGIAGIFIAKGKQITRGYVKVNDFYFLAVPDPEDPNDIDYNTPAWRQFVMCQEVGHIFGLAHQDESFTNANLGTCMDYTDDADGELGVELSNLSPNQHDLDQLAAMYGTSDGDDGNGKGGGNGGGKGKKGSPPGNEISQWGKAISTDGKGRPDLFELDLGNGNKHFTHVIWAN
jgi:hypothetical protein